MTKTTDRLCWNSNGAIGCEKPGHSAYPGGDIWMQEAWRWMSASERLRFAAESGQIAECETCKYAGRTT